MKPMKTMTALLALSALVLSGCSFQAGLNPTYFQYTPHAYEQKISGIGAIEMPKAVQDEVFTGKPTSFTGGGTTLTLPLGALTREAATMAFKDVFSQGVKLVESGTEQRGYTAIIRPRITQFTYEYNQLKNIGFAITPTAVVNLSVTLTDRTGKAIWERKFETGNFEGNTYIISGSPGDEISKTAHKALMKVMQEAADATHQELSTNPPTLPDGEKAL